MDAHIGSKYLKAHRGIIEWLLPEREGLPAWGKETEDCLHAHDAWRSGSPAHVSP